MQSVISGNDPRRDTALMASFNGILLLLRYCARFLNSRPARMQLPFPLQTMGFNINRAYDMRFQPITRSNEQCDAGYK
jgi:hypothetical protein